MEEEGGGEVVELVGFLGDAKVPPPTSRVTYRPLHPLPAPSSPGRQRASGGN